MMLLLDLQTNIHKYPNQKGPEHFQILSSSPYKLPSPESGLFLTL